MMHKSSSASESFWPLFLLPLQLLCMLCPVPLRPARDGSDCQPFPWVPGTVSLAAPWKDVEFVLVFTHLDSSCALDRVSYIQRGENVGRFSFFSAAVPCCVCIWLKRSWC